MGGASTPFLLFSPPHPHRPPLSFAATRLHWSKVPCKPIAAHLIEALTLNSSLVSSSAYRLLSMSTPAGGRAVGGGGAGGYLRWASAVPCFAQ
jgi:hypothetical protein